MKFLNGCNDTGILYDGSIINFLPDGKVVSYYSKEWRVCGHNKHQFKNKEQAIKIYELIDFELIKIKDLPIIKPQRVCDSSHRKLFPDSYSK